MFESRWERYNEAQTASVGLLAHLNYTHGQQVTLANIDLLNHRLSINATINDIFDWNQWDKTTTNPQLYSQSQLKPLSRYISFSVTYRIGKMDLEQANAGSRHRH